MHAEMIRQDVVVRRSCILIMTAAAMVVLCGCSTARHYQSHGDAKSLFATLHRQIKPGDSIERVRELLGPGTLSSDPSKSVARAQRMAQRFPEEYPAGVRVDDVFLGYDCGQTTLDLQFRSGQLINFKPERFEKTSDDGIMIMRP